MFRLSAEWYALSVQQLRAVERWRQPTPVPGTPQAVLGIINQRGALIPVIDVRIILGLDPTPLTRSTRLLLAMSDDVELALVADEVADLLEFEPHTNEPPPAHAALFCLGLAPTPFGPTILLDLAAVVHATRTAT